jgi:predicted GIY-YIG superfamily endonuclease
MVHIYHLYDKKIKAPVYVGATKNIKLRFSNHLATTLKEYVNKDAVCLEVLATVEQSEAGKAELFWLKEYTRNGIKLLNASSKTYPVGCKSYGTMAKQLRQDVIDAILKDADLYATVAKILKVAPSGLPQTLRRNGNKVTRMDNINAIAAAMMVEPEMILEEKEEATAV